VDIGAWAMVGAGSVVIRDVPSHGLVVGSPARLVGFVCKCGTRLVERLRRSDSVVASCASCELETEITVTEWESVRK
jgi:serine acetyltransferase